MVTAQTTQTLAPAVYRYGFGLFVLMASPPLVSWCAAQHGGSWSLWAWHTPLVYFGVVPLLDALIGAHPRNLSVRDEARLAQSRWFAALPIACVAIFLGLQIWGAWVWAQLPKPSWAALGWVVSMGCIGGVLGINAGHELIHKRSRFERAAGGAALSAVGYASFKIEHIYGHHVHVATPLDGSTARRGETVWRFIARALRNNVPRAYALDRARALRQGRSWAWWRSEITAWFALSAGFAAVCALIAGWSGLVYWCGQALVAIGLLETINYVEHYGLLRRQTADGRYEAVDARHSWNSDHLLTNLFLFNLQRHADHHAHAARRYQLLRHTDSSPQLPFGYATAVLLAWCPPLWRRVIHPRLDAWAARQALLPR